MKRRYLVVWIFEPGYNARYEEHKIDFFSEDNGWDKEEIDRIDKLAIGKMIEFECIYIIRLT